MHKIALSAATAYKTDRILSVEHRSNCSTLFSLGHGALALHAVDTRCTLHTWGNIFLQLLCNQPTYSTYSVRPITPARIYIAIRRVRFIFWLLQFWGRGAPSGSTPYTWVPWKFSGLPDYAQCYYSQHFHGLLFGSTLWMFLQNLKFVALSVPQIIGGTPKIWTVPGYALAFFSRKFLISFYSDWPYKCTRQICSPYLYPFPR